MIGPISIIAVATAVEGKDAEVREAQTRPVEVGERLILGAKQSPPLCTLFYAWVLSPL
jgi:hypothetical protein